MSPQEALATADKLVKQNKEQYEHDEPDINHENPLLQKCWYIQDAGKKRSRTQTEEKELGGAGTIKNKKQLCDAGVFSAAMGSGGGAEIKAESEKFVALQEQMAAWVRIVLPAASCAGGAAASCAGGGS